MVAHTVHILNATVPNVRFTADIRKCYAHLVNVPLAMPESRMALVYPETRSPSDFPIMVVGYPPESGTPIIVKRLQYVEQILNTKIQFDIKEFNFVPVKFEEDYNIPQVDVVLCTKTGPYTPYRNWPCFDQLKQRFNKMQISYVDLNEQKIMSNDCLNYVKKCKLYVGLETGTSHYVSQFANGKTLIIQSGFTSFNYWAYPYDYEAITSNFICPQSPCLLQAGCPFNHSCMDIEVDRVFEEIVKRL